MGIELPCWLTVYKISHMGRSYRYGKIVLGFSCGKKAIRDGKKWFFLDVGVFNGLMESIGGIKYPIVVNGQGPINNCVLAGPSCDGFDVIDMEAELPEIEIV